MCSICIGSGLAAPFSSLRKLIESKMRQSGLGGMHGEDFLGYDHKDFRMFFFLCAGHCSV